MEHETNLRTLRLRHGLQLTELSEASWLSDQYISRAELGEISPTPRLEDKLGAALEAVIAQRHERVGTLEQSFAACKGRLLQREESVPDE